MKKVYYFASDFHLGLDVPQPSKEREKIIITWLESIYPTTAELFLLGDLFDYWFEYQTAVPRGHVRFLASLARFTDAGIPVHVFTGNHDMWMFDYLEKEIGVKIYRKPQSFKLYGKSFLLGHGDGLGPADHGYKFIKKVFASKLNQWLFARLHPNTGINLMKRLSQKSEKQSVPFLGKDNEWLVQYCEEQLTSQETEYFIFGHRHLPISHKLSNDRSMYINLGDWLTHMTYVAYDGEKLELKNYEY